MDSSPESSEPMTRAAFEKYRTLAIRKGRADLAHQADVDVAFGDLMEAKDTEDAVLPSEVGRAEI